MSKIRRIATIKGIMQCTYAEAVFKLHRISVAKENDGFPSPLVQASIVAVIFERETLTVFEDIKRGMIQ
jgi:hypothetical protein